MPIPSSAHYEFGPFRLFPGQHALFQNSDRVVVGSKAFDILVSLVEAEGRLLDKEELMKRVWPDTFVEEGTLARHVSMLRKAIGDVDGLHYIETVPTRGYRFASPLRRVLDEAPAIEKKHSHIEAIIAIVLFAAFVGVIVAMLN